MMMDSGKSQNPSQGLLYEIALHTLFALSAIKSYTNWKISNEVKSAGKFDDLVFESDEKCMLLQAKFQSGMKYTKDFMTVNPRKSDFSIAKYFLSYLTLKKYFKITRNSLILCTAAKLKVADIIDELPADENVQNIFGPEAKMYKIKNEEGIVELLNTIKQFQNNISNAETEKDKKEWKHLDINTEDIKSFIYSFVIVKINLTNIKLVIVSKLSELDYEYNFRISSYEYVKDHVEEWSHLSINNFVPMTKDYLMFILCGEYNRNFLQKSVNTKIYFKESYRFNSHNIICVQMYDNTVMHLLKILRSIQESETSYFPQKENTLCLMPEMENTFHKMKYTMQYKVICDMINIFRYDKIKYLIVSFLSLNEAQVLELYEEICTITKKHQNKKVFIMIKEHYLENNGTLAKTIHDKIYFNSLATDTQKYILDKNILFQGELVTLMNLINNTENIISEIDKLEIDECLKKIIFDEDNYSIGCNLQTQSKPDEFYVERSLIANSEVIAETKFFEKMDKNIVVVTGPPGAGKTTFLKQIVSLKKAKDKVDSKLTWIINVDLKKAKQFFRKDIEKTMSNLLCHNENITSDSSYLVHSERKLFESMNKILIIDGLDENCSEDIKKIQNLLADSLQALNISLVIMGARDYDFILKELKDVHSCELVRLLPFSPRDQSSFLKEYLKQIIPVNTENDLFEEVIIEFAIAFSESICSTPLSLKMISKIIKNNIFRGDSIESLSKVFDNFANEYYFYNCYLEVRKDEFAQDDDIYRQSFDRYIHSLRKLAAKNLFPDFPDLLGLLNVDASFKINKDALNVGLLKESDEGYTFVHKTFEEYFAAELLWDCLYKKRHIHDLLLKVLNEVFLNDQYEGVSNFFERILEISQNEKMSELSMAYNLALTEVNWKRNISLLSYRGRLFIIKLIFDNYTNFYHILKTKGRSGTETALLNSCIHPSLVKYFVEKGAKIDKANDIGFIILKFMFRKVRIYTNLSFYRKMFDIPNYNKSAVDLLKFLTREYAMNLNLCDQYGNTLSYYAAGSNSLEAIKYIKEQGANLNIFNKNKYTPVHIAANSGALEVLRYLVEDCKMDLTVSDDNGNLPAHMAADGNQVEILSYFKSIGIELNQCNNDRQNLVHIAAAADAIDVLNFLKNEYNFFLNIDLCDKHGYTPSHHAAAYNARKAIRYLKEQGANLSIPNKNKSTLVHIAAESGALEVLRYLVEDCKMDVTVSDDNGNLPAHMAAVGNRVDILRYLKSIEIELNQCNNKGETLAHKAAAADAVDVLNFLKNECKFSLNLDLCNKYGYTPSHHAAACNALKAIKYLKEQGANLSISTMNRHTVIHIAAMVGALEVLRYLVEDCKMDVTVSDNNGNLPAHMAADSNKVEILRYLKSIKIELNQCNNKGETLVHRAAAANAVDVLNFLKNECKFS
uniref:Uncharacterized protein LOC114338107 n=1 Tax=Diabrotica virgifera virgifera TaxID=50390 RepID=A0A6P7G625_DIAVI